MKKRNLKKERGVTLIALVVTIVVLLILAGVSINMVLGNNGLISKAKDAKEKTEQDQLNTEKGMNNLYDEMMGILGENGGDGENGGNAEDSGGDVASITGGKRYDTTAEYTDSNGDKAMIPASFTVSGIPSETTIDGGLVIYDIPEGTTVDWTNPDSVKTKYNQFVWIPVEVNKTVEPVDTTTSIANFYRTSEGSSYYIEPFPAGKNSYGKDYYGDTILGTGIATQIEKLTESIYNYGGFYIGRYEAGSTTQRTRDSSQMASFVVQQDKYPYNYVKWGTSMSDVSSGGAVYISNKLYSSTNTNYGATSMLCTAACWDTMLDFVKDSNHSVTSSINWGNYYGSETYKVYRGSYAIYSNKTLGSFTASDTINGTEVPENECILLTTGATERNSSKNIYDIAGNCCEWTTEADISSNQSRVIRGGNYGNGHSTENNPSANRP